jgi:malectin (di-glucose binding ER protein)
MGTTVDFSRENKELQNILASGVFDRSPMLAQLLRYVCAKYFEGCSEGIKEYSIAVDVLGRTSDFDPKKDSIIRVQFHRLREKLNEYYANGGANHAVQILIPHGHYAPQFSYREDASRNGRPTGLAATLPDPSESASLPVEEVPGILPPLVTARKRYLRRLGVAAAGVAILGAVAFSLAGGSAWRKKPINPIVATPVGESVRILAGLADGNYTDGYGHVWVSDRFFHGGSVATSGNHPIWGTRDPRLYQSWRQGAFSYDIPAKPGDYEVRLYFAETYFGDGNAAGYGGENTRFFDISINGVTVKRHLSVAGEGGVNVAVVKVFQDVSPAGDGFVHIGFVKATNEPFVNAIELKPGVPGRLDAIRLIAQPQGYTDSNGQVWVSDRLAVGGQVVTRTADITGGDDRQLYGGERFGNFSYTIPVTPGKYTVTLHMAERWLGPGQPGGQSGVGSRLFDILCNGVFLERNLDVYERAGGPNRALTRIYRGIEPNHQGNIVLSFVPTKNFGIVSAIEVIQE